MKIILKWKNHKTVGFLALFGLRLISQRTCLYKIMKPFGRETAIQT